MIKIWNVETWEKIRNLSGHSSWILSVTFSKDGKIFASGSNDKMIKIWNVKNWEEISSLSGHSS